MSGTFPAVHRPFAGLLKAGAGEILDLEKTVWLTRAPASIGVLGEPFEPLAGHTLLQPLARSVYCAVQGRDDDVIRIRSLMPADWGGMLAWDGRISDIFTKKGPPRSQAVLNANFEEHPWMMRVIAIMLGMRRARQLNTPRTGFDMVIWNRCSPEGGLNWPTAFGTAVGLALKAAAGSNRKRIDGVLLGRAIRQGLHDVLGEARPLAPFLATLLGRRGCLFQTEHMTNPKMHWVPMPQGIRVVSLHTGQRDPIPDSARQKVRVGSEMGLHLANKALSKKSNSHQQIGGWPMIVPGDFEKTWRGEIPTKLKGDAFLSEAKKVDFADEVVPEENYRCRAFSEHIVREKGRVLRFLEHLDEYARTKKDGVLAETGRSLFASHRSYLEKTGLNYDACESVMSELKGLGKDAGVFGARMATGGAVGTLAVLVHESGLDRLRELSASLRSRGDGHAGDLVVDSGEGALTGGWWEGVLVKPEQPESEKGEEASSN